MDLGLIRAWLSLHRARSWLFAVLLMVAGLALTYRARVPGVQPGFLVPVWAFAPGLFGLLEVVPLVEERTFGVVVIARRVACARLGWSCAVCAVGGCIFYALAGASADVGLLGVGLMVEGVVLVLVVLVGVHAWVVPAAYCATAFVFAGAAGTYRPATIILGSLPTWLSVGGLLMLPAGIASYAVLGAGSLQRARRIAPRPVLVSPRR